MIHTFLLVLLLLSSIGVDDRFLGAHRRWEGTNFTLCALIFTSISFLESIIQLLNWIKCFQVLYSPNISAYTLYPIEKFDVVFDVKNHAENDIRNDGKNNDKNDGNSYVKKDEKRKSRRMKESRKKLSQFLSFLSSILMSFFASVSAWF